MKLSVVISAYNEEKNIAECLESVKSIADEIILIDNSSTDNTKEIAKKYTSKIITQENDITAIDLLKNKGIESAKGEWVLVIDADESLSKELSEEISKSIDNSGDSGDTNGYLMPRKNFIFGKWMQHTGWYPDYQLRLFRNGKGKYVEKHIHESIKVNGKTEKLSKHIIHSNYEGIQSFLRKMVIVYAPNEAEERVAKGYVFSFSDAFRFPLNEFISRFFAREGYKDGFHGLMLSILMAFYHFIVFAFLWEKNQFKEMDHKEMLIQFEQDKEKAEDELFHWINITKIKNEKNFLKKLALRTKRKLKKIL